MVERSYLYTFRKFLSRFRESLVRWKIVNADGKYILQGNEDRESILTIPTEAKSFSIGSDGVVSYVDDDGELQTAGQIIIAKFSNNGGLEKIGSNEYQETTNSGTPLEGVPGGDDWCWLNRCRCVRNV